MAPPSKISQLPEALTEALDERLKESNYFNIDAHHAWLMREVERMGIELEQPISRSAVGRYSRMRKSQNMSIQDSVREMRAFEAEFGDDPLAFVQNGNNVAQMLAFKRMQAAKNGDVEVDEDFLKDMSLALGRMAKTAFINDERTRKTREDERALAVAEAAAKVDAVIESSKGASNSDTIELIRQAIAGGLSA